jgi:hypothetical protein
LELAGALALDRLSIITSTAETLRAWRDTRSLSCILASAEKAWQDLLATRRASHIIVHAQTTVVTLSCTCSRSEGALVADIALEIVAFGARCTSRALGANTVHAAARSGALE